MNAAQEMRAWHVLFFVQLSKLCRTTRALVLPWLGEREDFLLRLAKEYFVGLQPDPVAAGVFGRLFDLGGSRPQRFWCSFGARLARYSGGCKDVWRRPANVGKTIGKMIFQQLLEKLLE